MFYLIGALIVALVLGFGSRSILSGVVSFFVTWLALYFVMPTFSFGFMGLPILMLFLGIFTLIAPFCAASLLEQRLMPRQLIPGTILTLTALFGVTILPLATSAPMFHADSYHAVIGDLSREGSSYASDTAPVDVSQVRVVDQALAHQLAEKRLGQEAGLGSRATVGTMNIQMVDGHLYWVGPLNHSSFSRWMSHEGTPGYIMVSATEEDDVTLVQEAGGEDIVLRYNMGSCFGDYPPRLVYESGYATVGRANFTFEVDDTGRPHWVVTTYEKKVGYGGANATGVVVLDAQTGDSEWHAVGDAPAWIDRIQPHTFLVEQLQSWGWYHDGWWNSFWDKEGVITPTTGAVPADKDDDGPTAEAMVLVHGADGRAYWYSGITSYGTDDSTTGFVLIDSRTKEARYYRQSGATETAAMRSAEGAVQEKNYTATTPIMYNVGGRPTYFITLKDKEGLVKRVVWVSVENYSLVGLGADKASALRNYRNALYARGNEVAPGTSSTRMSVTGIVDRIRVEPTAESTTYYLLLEEVPDKLFSGSPTLNDELRITQPGDKVELQFDGAGTQVVTMAAFDNLGIELQKHAAQEAVEKYAEEVRRKKRENQEVEDADAAFDNLSDGEKRELLKQLRKKSSEATRDGDS